MFLGVEPEPFETGQHFIDASGKLSLLSNILGVLHKKLVYSSLCDLARVSGSLSQFSFSVSLFLFMLAGEVVIGSSCSLR